MNTSMTMLKDSLRNITFMNSAGKLLRFADTPEIFYEGVIKQPATILFTIIIGLLVTLALPLLAMSAMEVSIIQSIVLNKKLKTAIFSKLFDKKVLKYFGIIIFLITLALSISALGGFLEGVVPATVTFIIPFVIIFLLAIRLALIPLSLAVGGGASSAITLLKTKGKFMPVFKIITLVAIVLFFFDISQLLLEGSGEMLGLAPYVVRIFISIPFLIILIPLWHLDIIALSYLYKKIG